MSITRLGAYGTEREVGTERPTKEREVGLNELLQITDPIELKRQALAYLGANRESEEKLSELAIALRGLEKKSNGKENRGQAPTIEDLRKKYEALIPPAKRKRVLFSSYLAKYLTEAIAVSAGRFVSLVAAIKERAAEQKQKTTDKEIKTLAPEIRREWLRLMDGRRHLLPFQRHPEHQARIADFETKMKSEWLHQSQEKRARLEATHEQELLLGFIMEKEGLFGAKAKVWPTDKYDDYFTHADLAVQAESGPTILADLTTDLDDAGEKLYYNQQRPARFLEYPPDRALLDKMGLPVVLGITKSDADADIEEFLENEARARLAGTSGGERRANDGRPGKTIPPESLARWVDYLFLQLNHQKDYISKHASRISVEEERARYQDVLAEYDRAIGYFEKLKKERYPQVKLDEQRPWDRKFMSAPSLARDYARREGLAEDSPPRLPLHPEVF